MKIAGSDVKGRESYSDLNDFLERAVELYEGEPIGDSFNRMESSKVGISAQGAVSNTVELGPSGRGGNARIEFDDAKNTANFSELLAVLDTADFL